MLLLIEQEARHELSSKKPWINELVSQLCKKTLRFNRIVGKNIEMLLAINQT
jgi:hypothetical protein